ncbi:hypothetical protein PHYBOEH_008199 [Phytophthora boehmeriae]|uniref:Amine oxidase domain-containing protein n=1 Tax=Phytophthora boehmeriae TaxID=109152 RepID=A0A8T1X087_9STRA|nr:hypothetical protein PHYBOEH_008199 [Phytophthora boehmeriae]
MRTLVVGGGLTGAALVRLLQDARQAAAYASDVVVWDRNSIAGGRVMGRSFPKQRDVHVDMGAQYWTPRSDQNDEFRQKLLQSGHLRTFAEQEIAQDPYRSAVKTHFVCPKGKGFRGMVEHLLDGVETCLLTEVESFDVLDEKHIKVRTTKGKEEVVNELVLTCPIPNVMAILKKSMSSQVNSQTLQALENVTYSQRFAAAYLFNEETADEVQKMGWTARYVAPHESEIIRFVCWDHLKKKANGKSQPALIVHTSVPFGATFMDDIRPNDEILSLITKSLREVLPTLPTELDARLHRWRISQVMEPYHDPTSANEDESPAAVVLSTHPRIIVAGDGFQGSNFDSCLLSAKAAVQLLQDPKSGL